MSGRKAIRDMASLGVGRLTFHAIDTWSGATLRPLRVDLTQLDESEYRRLDCFETALDGRSDGAWLEGAAFAIGRYQLTLHVGEYYAALGASLPTPPFLSHVLVRFGISDATQRYHVVVLFGPWSYAFYRGS